MEHASESIDIEGILLPCLTLEESIGRVLRHSNGELVKVAWVNAHCANQRRERADYARALDTFQYVFNDGVGVQLAARMQGRIFPENLNGTDWIPEFLSRLDAQQEEDLQRVFLLGATEEALSACIKRFEKRWPNLAVVGARHGYYTDAKEVVRQIVDARTQLLIVGMGVPRQEMFLAEQAKHLEAGGVRVAIAGGAILDFLGGTVRRAPELVRSLRAEWVWRLSLEPVRLARRYLVGNPVFLYHAFRRSLRP